MENIYVQIYIVLYHGCVQESEVYVGWNVDFIILHIYIWWQLVFREFCVCVTNVEITRLSNSPCALLKVASKRLARVSGPACMQDHYHHNSDRKSSLHWLGNTASEETHRLTDRQTGGGNKHTARYDTTAASQDRLTCTIPGLSLPPCLPASLWW